MATNDTVYLVDRLTVCEGMEDYATTLAVVWSFSEVEEVIRLDNDNNIEPCELTALVQPDAETYPNCWECKEIINGRAVVADYTTTYVVTRWVKGEA